MSKVVVSVEVSKEAYELGQGVVKFALAVKESLANGWQLGEDMPIVIAAAFSELVPAISGVSQIGDEFKEDPAAFAQAFALAGGELAKMFRA